MQTHTHTRVEIHAKSFSECSRQTSSNRMKKKCDPCDFDHGMTVGARWWLVLETAEILRVYTEWCEKQLKSLFTTMVIRKASQRAQNIDLEEDGLQEEKTKQTRI